MTLDVIVDGNQTIISVTKIPLEINVTQKINNIIISPIGIQGEPGIGGVPRNQIFIGQTLITVNHFLGYKPIIEVFNTNGEEIDGLIEHSSSNVFTVSFNIPQSGIINYL